MRGGVESAAEMKVVIEVSRLERNGCLKLRDAVGGVFAKPISDSEMVMRSCEFGVEVDSGFEALDGFVASVQHGQEESDFVLDTRGFRIEMGGFFPGCEGTRRISACFQLLRAGLQLRERFLSGKR